jgi:CHASE2 domain-containing sensor protein
VVEGAPSIAPQAIKRRPPPQDRTLAHGNCALTPPGQSPILDDSLGSGDLGFAFSALDLWRVQPFELLVYDALRVAWAGHEPSTRISLVGITEDDIANFDWPPKDGELAGLLERIVSWQPRVVGVDIYRDKPKPPGTERLNALLARHPEIVWTFKMQERGKAAVLPPEVLRGTDRAVFSDVLTDPGLVVRRGLLYADNGVENYTAWGWRSRWDISLPTISRSARETESSCASARP